MAHLVACAQASRSVLMTYLTRQRWFRQSDAGAGEAWFTALASLSPTVAWAQVAWDSAENSRYQIPICLCRSDAVAAEAIIFDAAPHVGAGWVLADAMHHEASRLMLAEALQKKQSWSCSEGRWESHPGTVTEHDQAPPPQVGALLTLEQSNTSAVFDATQLFKLYRRLEPGINPDPEMTAFLSQTRGFDHVPRLLSTLRFVPLPPGPATDVAMVQEYVADAQDGWTYFLHLLQPWLAQGPAAQEPLPALPAARALGAVTRKMHDALMGADHPDFAAMTATAPQVLAWIAQAEREAHEGLVVLEQKLPELPPINKLLAQAVLGGRTAVAPAFAAIRQGLQDGAGACIRLHGDFHLGQVLHTRDNTFKIIDFEGEPMRPVAERRARHSPLRDVAGMLRSFAYAAAAAGQATADGAQASAMAHHWQGQVSDAFVATYLGAQQSAALPPSAAGIRHLLALFSFEKAMYELRYELNHRPAWVGIPLSGLNALLQGD